MADAEAEDQGVFSLCVVAFVLREDLTEALAKEVQSIQTPPCAKIRFYHSELTDCEV